MKSVILDLHQQLKSNKVDPATLVNNAKAIVDKYAFTNSIITPIFKTDNLKFDENNLLSCIPYSLKDNFTTMGILTTGGSKFLSNYIPPFNSTAYELLNMSGATLLSKDSMDEFGLGGTGLHCLKGPVKNPWNENKIVGGSSSGSAINVAIGASAFALGTDTGDSIRRPASWVGICGYKPTYGAISRYGVLPYAPSFDTVGILTKYVTDTVIVASQIIKQDFKDYTSTNLIKNVKLENLAPLSQIKFVVIKNWLKFVNKEAVTKFNELLTKLSNAGHLIEEVELDEKYLTWASFVYKIISYADAYSCYSNLQGLTFCGKQDDNDEYFASLTKLRTEGTCEETKRRLIIGGLISNNENLTRLSKVARSLRHQIQDAEVNILSKGDCILMPTLSDIASDANNIGESLYNQWLVFGNCSGTPSISLPFTKINNMPFGITVSADIYQDMKLLNIALTLESIIGGDHE